MASFSYQLRGTSGSGKTTVARALMEQAQAQPVEYNQTKRDPQLHPLVYQGRLIDHDFVVIGCYRPRNGGCDTIPKVQRTAELVEKYVNRPDTIVFFEGLMISHMLGTVGQMQMRVGRERSVMGFLDTPLWKCLERVKQRRLEAGNNKPFNPDNTIKDWPRVHLSRRNATQQGYTVCRVNHEQAVLDVTAQLEAMVYGVPLPGRTVSMDQWPMEHPAASRPEPASAVGG